MAKFFEKKVLRKEDDKWIKVDKQKFQLFGKGFGLALEAFSLFYNHLKFHSFLKMGAIGIDGIWDMSDCTRRMIVTSLIICHTYICRLRLHGCSLDCSSFRVWYAFGLIQERHLHRLVSNVSANLRWNSAGWFFLIFVADKRKNKIPIGRLSV